MGGSSGIGLEVGRKCVGLFNTVYVVGTRGDFAEPGLTYLPCDLRNTQDVQNLIGRVASESIGLLVYSAGAFENDKKDRAIEARSQINAMFDLHVSACVHLVTGLRTSLADGATIAVFSSTASERVAASTLAYSVAKGAIPVLVRHLAEQMRGKVNVIGISPGLVRTPMSSMTPEPVWESVLTRTPAGRLTTSEDIANLLIGLVRSGSGMLTGHTLTVDGGNLWSW